MPRMYNSRQSKIKPNPDKVETLATVTQAPVSNTATCLVGETLTNESDYDDTQFNDDLTKAARHLDLLVKEALEEHAQGKTQEFPV